MSITYLKEAVPAAQVAKDLADVKETVTGVIADIRERGDEAVREYSAKFDNWSPGELPARRPARSRTSSRRCRAGHRRHPVRPGAGARRSPQAQLESMREIEVETLPGVFLGHKHLPIASAGAYIPGGRYPLTASAHMTC